MDDPIVAQDLVKVYDHKIRAVIARCDCIALRAEPRKDPLRIDKGLCAA